MPSAPARLVLGDGVGHAQHAAPSAERRTATLHHHRALMTGQAVHHGVLDQRLQNQARHPHARRCPRARAGSTRQPVRKALLLQLQVQAHELQLVAQPREVALAGVQQAAQQIRELHHHGLRALRIPLDVAADGVQQIEQRVRRQLHAQRRQARRAPLALERRALAVPNCETACTAPNPVTSARPKP